MLDNKVGMQNRKMVDFINMGEFFTGQEKQKDGCVCKLWGRKKTGRTEDKAVNHGGILKGTLGSYGVINMWVMGKCQNNFHKTKINPKTLLKSSVLLEGNGFD